MDYQNSDSTVKVHQFSIKRSTSKAEVVLEHLMQEFKLVVVEKHDFGNIDVFIDEKFGFFDRSLIGKMITSYPKAQG